jgi:hypothetical protein
MRTEFILARIIKFGLPLGLMLGVCKIVYSWLFTEKGIDSDVLFSSIYFFILGLFWAFILSLYQLRKKS